VVERALNSSVHQVSIYSRKSENVAANVSGVFRNVKRGSRGSSAEGRMEAPKTSTGVGSGEGVSPSPVGVGSGKGAVPPPQKIFGIFSFEMVYFDAFWSTF